MSAPFSEVSSEPPTLREPDISTAHPNMAFLYRPTPPAGRDDAAED